MKMNKTTLPQFRTDFAKAVADLEAQYGVKIRLGNITYNTNDFHTRLEVKNVGTDETSSKELWLAEQSKAYWKNALVKKVEYDKWYLGNDGHNYKVIGFNTTRPKNILRIVNGLGKEYSCPLGFLGIRN